ncbi:MAG TPA: aldehyde dehydrogenase family protein [Actinomycetota bacterium]
MNVDRFYIGGGWVEPDGERVVDVLNPATEEVIATAVEPSAADARRAIQAARAAFDDGPWPGMAPKERAAHLRRMAEILTARKREIGELLIREVGATVMLAKTFQGTWAIETIANAADWAEVFPWEEELAPRDQPVTVRALAIREPVGVVAAMTPFNYPFYVNCLKVGPAIAMGNSIVLKPSPWTPLDAFELARAAEEAGIPAGVVNVIGGGGIEVGQELASNPLVDMVSFTGSVAGGRAVGATAMQTIKKVQLELGGKSAVIALDDADPATVAGNVMNMCMLHAGQGCGCTTRLLVPRARHDEMVDAVVGAARALPIGDPSDPSVFVGPLIREQHRRRVESCVEIGRAEGATVATGGRRPPQLPKGFFYEPTVFVDVQNSMRIAQEEIFGPVLCVIAYDDIDDAVRIANDSIYGLGGAVLSASRERATEVARRLRTGFVQINGAVPPNYNGSWGGYKQSGLGREWRLGLEEYTELKHLGWMEL